MQNTSSLYRQILADTNHWYEAKVEIGNRTRLSYTNSGATLSSKITFTETSIFSISTDSVVLDSKPAIGRCISQEIDLTVRKPSSDLPRMAAVLPYVRICNKTQQSEWIHQGVFFVDTKEITHNDDGLDLLTIHGYDAMMMANSPMKDTGVNWGSSGALSKPVVNAIATTMGIPVDSRTWTHMDDNYRVSYPGTYDMIEVLGYIGTMYLGNWVITETGKLRLITLLELPEETSLLVDHVGDALVFGTGTGAARILV